MSHPISSPAAPLTGGARPLFIGCACDRKFVEPTATMLCSVDRNGEVPEAVVLLAAFGLDDLDRATLRAAAGRLGPAMRFVDVTGDMLRTVDSGHYTEAYPLPVLGRLFLADHVGVPGARLLTLDSDMIVNVSLRPLFGLDLGEEFFAATHDAPRQYDLDYFNSGLTMFEVDAYRHHDIASRSLRWLADQNNHPTFPDQDALNLMVGHRWHRLDRAWNHFCHSGSSFDPSDWEAGKVAHFAGAKPWVQPGHGGERLYYRYNAELHRRLAAAGVVPRFRRSPRIDALLTWSGAGAGAASPPGIVLGCACDPGTVACTAAMLASFDLNGRLPAAEILIAGFGLEGSEEAALRLAAGNRPVRFVDLRGRMAELTKGSDLTVSAAVQARLLLAEQVEGGGTRLLVLESATIINGDLRPLIFRDLGTNFFAAIPDQCSPAGEVRFCAGVTMIDVDGYRFHDIGARAIRWIAERGGGAAAPDQDALNDVIGRLWHRLAQTWNLFRQGSVELVAEDYERCRIARFVGTMPWDDEHHPGRLLFDAYAEAARLRIAAGGAKARVQAAAPIDRAFIAACYELFLGRELEDERVVAERAHLSRERLIASVVDSDEFRDNVQHPLEAGEPLPAGLFRRPLAAADRDWARDELPLSVATRAVLHRAEDWPELLSMILGDGRFPGAVGIAPLRIAQPA